MSIGFNSHFVSRFLTEPWEYGQRMLWYYDFDQDSLHTCSSRSLFARSGLNTPETETRLNRLIESPIAAARKQLLGAPPGGAVEILDWPTYRALALLLLLQPFRSPGPTGSNQTLEQTPARPENEIDGLAHAIAAGYRLMRITVAPHSPLFYPSAGYFPVLGESVDGAYAFAVAIPLSERQAILGIPTSVQPSQLGLWRANGAGFLANYSVGTGCRRVVVHPSAVDSLHEADIATAIRGARDGVTRALALCRELTEIVRRMDLVYSH